MFSEHQQEDNATPFVREASTHSPLAKDLGPKVRGQGSLPAVCEHC